MNSKPRTVFSPVFILLACLGLCGVAPAAFADDPMPFPPDPDQAAIADGAKLPKLVKRVEPVGPPDAATSGQEQRVFVAFLVDAKGKVCAAAPMFAPPAAVAQAAVDAVSQWEFEPGLHYSPNSKRMVPVGTQMTVLIRFPATPLPSRE